MKKLTKPSFGQLFIFALIALLSVATAVSAGLAYNFYQAAKSNSTESAASVLGGTTQTDAYDRVIAKVREIVLLPDEQPTVAAISNVDEVRKDNPQFYGEAQNGDIVLIFTTKAIIYRQDPGIVINVAPVIREQENQ